MYLITLVLQFLPILRLSRDILSAIACQSRLFSVIFTIWFAKLILFIM